MHALAHYVHNLDPYVFNLYGWGPRWYGLAYLLGFLLAYLLLKRLARQGMLRIPPERVPDLVLNCCIFGVLIGGRLGYVLFYDLPNSLADHHTPLLWDFSASFPYWGVITVWRGGMSAHGGILFTILTLMVFGWRQQSSNATNKRVFALVAGVFVVGSLGWWLASCVSASLEACVVSFEVGAVGWMVFFGWRNAIPITNVGDASCMVVPIGLFFGRLANFVNGELYGRPADVPWAVKFPSEIYAPTNNVIDPAVDAKLPLILDSLNLPLGKEGLDMLAEKLQRHSQEAVRVVGEILPARHPSQLYEALLEGLVLFLVCWFVGRHWRKEGMASGAFLTLYPIARIIGEHFRVGDTPVQVMGMQISKGVLYSVPMALAGAVYWGYWIWRNRKTEWIPQPAKSPEPPAADPKPLKSKT